MYSSLQDIESLLISLAAILHLGDVQFKAVGNNDSAQIVNMDVLERGRDQITETIEINSLFIDTVFIRVSADGPLIGPGVKVGWALFNLNNRK